MTGASVATIPTLVVFILFQKLSSAASCFQG